jgi:ABC-type amino acid transport substrate-binding protein
MPEIKQDYTLAEILEIIGDPDELARKMEKDRADWAAFSLVNLELLKKYPKKWIVFCDGEVRAVGSSLASVLEKADALGLPRDDILAEYLNPDPETLIL